MNTELFKLNKCSCICVGFIYRKFSFLITRAGRLELNLLRMLFVSQVNLDFHWNDFESDLTCHTQLFL